MIEQYLSNNNKKRYSTNLPKILDLNQPQIKGFLLFGSCNFAVRVNPARSRWHESRSSQLDGIGMAFLALFWASCKDPPMRAMRLGCGAANGRRAQHPASGTRRS
jgi:hypothetical protein